MKLSFAIATLSVLLASSGCDRAKDEPKRPDLAPSAASKEPDDKAAAKPPAATGRVFFVQPADGATVPEQFEVEFGVEGKQVRPAGATERDPAFGHHHLLIDDGPIADLVVVPKDETHLHYGDGATKATIKLSPGKHRLTMQFADGAHMSYGPDWSATIEVEVQAAGADAGADGAAAAAADGGAEVAADG